MIINAVLYDVNELKEASIKLLESEHQNRIKYEHELQLRKELIKECVIYYQLNLTTGIIEEYETKLVNMNHLMVGKKINTNIHSSSLSSTHPDDLFRVFKEISPLALKERYQNGESSVSCVYRRKLQDENYRYVKTNAVTMTRPGTKDIISLIYCNDIDRKWKDHIAVETILDEDVESIFHIDIKSGIAYIAHMQEAVNYVGVYDHFDFRYECARTCELVVVREDRNIFSRYYKIENLVKYLENDKMVSATYRVNEENGVHKKLMTAYYMDEQKDTIVMTRRDITKLDDEEQRQKEELQKAVASAQKANKAKSDFLSHMSHDLRTPLNAVLTYSNRELIDEATPGQLYEYLRKVNVSGDYLLGIINDVLDMSRIEQDKITLNPEPYYLADFEETIKNVIGELCRNKNIDFVMKLPSTPVLGILVDKVRLTQIFVNLLSNAVKFTPSGGKVEFIIDEIRPISNTEVMCKCIVRDNGIGMSEDFIPHAFESFNQEFRKDIKDRSVGTGLGLPIVKELVRLMKGTISLESELDKGTTFTVEIPLKLSDVIKKPKEKVNRDYNLLKNMNILLVEDNSINMEIANALLKKKGCVVHNAEDGEEACLVFERSSVGFYHVILMDIRMPIMDGLEATRKIRAMDREDAATVPIVAMTADAFHEDVNRAIDAGMNAHIAKPIDPEKLYDVLCSY